MPRIEPIDIRDVEGKSRALTNYLSEVAGTEVDFPAAAALETANA